MNLILEQINVEIRHRFWNTPGRDDGDSLKLIKALFDELGIMYKIVILPADECIGCYHTEQIELNEKTYERIQLAVQIMDNKSDIVKLLHLVATWNKKNQKITQSNSIPNSVLLSFVQEYGISFDLEIIKAAGPKQLLDILHEIYPQTVARICGKSNVLNDVCLCNVCSRYKFHDNYSISRDMYDKRVNKSYKCVRKILKHYVENSPAEPTEYLAKYQELLKKYSDIKKIVKE